MIYELTHHIVKTDGISLFYFAEISLTLIALKDQDNETFKDLLKANIDKHMQMTIYSSKTQQLRGKTCNSIVE